MLPTTTRYPFPLLSLLSPHLSNPFASSSPRRIGEEEEKGGGGEEPRKVERMMQQDQWNAAAAAAGGLRPTKSAPCSPVKPMLKAHSDCFHVIHKVPVGDTPYVRAKRVQLVDKDPEKAIALFWAAINAGDRVDSALKDMAIVMKQQNRAEEAIEAVKSLRHRCSDQAQESLDNILLDLYKRCGRLDDQIILLRRKLQLIHQGLAFNGKRTKTARSQGRKFQVTLEQEATRLLGNLGWALMQQENYTEAESAYRRALLIGADNNKMCNLGICLMKQGRILEAKDILKQVRPAAIDGMRGADSHLKAFERAQEMLRDLEAKLAGYRGREQLDKNWLFDAFLGSSSAIWQPQPCIDYLLPPRDRFADENADMSRQMAVHPNTLNVAAQPFYSLRMPPPAKGVNALQQQQQQLHDPLGNLKRTRSGNAMDRAVQPKKPAEESLRNSSNGRRRSLSAEDRWPELPDNAAFDEAIVAAVLAPVLDDKSEVNGTPAARHDTSPAPSEGKRLRIFQDITQALHAD